MKHVIPLLVIVLSALAIAAILLPADAWTNHFVFRLAIVLALGTACYFYGIANGKAAVGAAGRRPWLQYSLRTLLLITTLLAISLGIYCGRVREQRDAVEVLKRIHGCRVDYDDYPPALGEYPSRLVAWSEEVLGVDFVHDAVTVWIRASEAEKSMPHLKRLPYLQTVSVDIDDGPEGDLRESELIKDSIEREKTRSEAIKKLKSELPHARVEATVESPICLDPVNTSP